MADLTYDLHTHSTHSDGTTTVAELVQGAVAAGLAGISLTDHDTCAGWDEAREATALFGIDFLPGIELTTKHGCHSVHLLGYGMNPHYEPLATTLLWLREQRVQRVEEMVMKLAADYPLSLAKLRARAQGAVGRPHIADELVELGIVADRAAAFATLLSHRSKYYVPGQYLETRRAIQLVRAAGGVPVLAHPAAGRNHSAISRADMQEFVTAGLLGIELRHPENNPELLQQIEFAAAGLGLLVTGSSDYHGSGKPNRLGDETTEAAVVAQIRQLAAVPR
ncbi:PHP domain-containing protein [Canibacter oris]|uniref:Polymerase/histidinol phosphatase N-terminal domain-containing protein n=1 Tax=Canibacter oris TaxID=1365628 RepID=A0A840DG22_9MICO|nr:PHP domain-containing protein [Canibacter oris]MBB4070735.1 hypothetical protein [Canibacter oris]